MGDRNPQHPDRRTSYDVRIWKIRTYQGRRGKTYSVRWSVAGSEHRETFKKRALADRRRAELLTKTAQGVPFDIATGLPVTEFEKRDDVTWYEHACAYVDMKWDRAAGNTREGIADALATVTPALIATKRGKPDPRTLRRALHQWAFNKRWRQAGEPPEEYAAAVKWVQRNTLPVSALAEGDVLRAALDQMFRKQDGPPAAANTFARKRAVLHQVLDYAVEKNYLYTNPLTALTWKTPKTAEVVNPRVVVNQQQARALIDAVREQGRMGPHLVAFFGCLYYAGLRPAEAVELREHNLDIPDDGWGSLHLGKSAPSAGGAWTEDGKRRQQRGLKHRAHEHTREVPCPPQLTRLLRAHLDLFGTSGDGRLFRGERGGDLSDTVYQRVWSKARMAVLGPAEAESPLAGRPYDLRHAALSTWLNAGVPATQVAEWAGNGVDVLLRVYAKCVAGQEENARRRVDEALQEPPTPGY